MNYELAKQLKEAGFIVKDRWIKDVSGIQHAPKDYIAGATNNGDGSFSHVYIPTLSELIEACPKSSPTDGNEDFTLSSRQDHWIAGFEAYETWSYQQHGNTPEEAVAKLWLELNKK